MRCSGHGGLRGARGEFGAVAGAVDDELVGTIGKTVEGGVGEDGVGEESHPLAHVAVRSDDEAGPAVAFDDEGVEVFGLLLAEPLEPEVIDDKQVGSEVAAKDRLEAMVGPRLAE